MDSGTWAEDDDDEMDFNKPIVIPSSSEPPAPGKPAAPTSTAPAVLDPLEEAKILARKKQQQLERMQEQMIEQQKRAEVEAHDRVQQMQREEHELQRRAMDDERRRREDERLAMENRRREMEAHAVQERARVEEMRMRQEEAARKAEDARMQREQELEVVKNQTSLMKESMQASVQRRIEEEKRAEAERVARLEGRLRELDKKKEEREAAEKVRSDFERREEVERRNMRERELILQQQQQQHFRTSAGGQAFHAAQAGAGGQQFGAFGAGRRGGGPKKLYDPKNDRFVMENASRALGEKGGGGARPQIFPDASVGKHDPRARREQPRAAVGEGEMGESQSKVPQRVTLLQNPNKPAQSAAEGGPEPEASERNKVGEGGQDVGDIGGEMRAFSHAHDSGLQDPVFTLTGEWIHNGVASMPGLQSMPQVSKMDSCLSGTL